MFLFSNFLHVIANKFDFQNWYSKYIPQTIAFLIISYAAYTKQKTIILHKKCHRYNSDAQTNHTDKYFLSMANPNK